MSTDDKVTDDKTLEELEEVQWEPPKEIDSFIGRVLLLRKTRLRDLTESDISFLVSQNMGSKYILSRALDILEREPLMEAEHHEGDLLENILKLSPDFLLTDEEVVRRIRSLAEKALLLLPLGPEEVYEEVNKALTDLISRFLSTWR